MALGPLVTEINEFRTEATKATKGGHSKGEEGVGAVVTYVLYLAVCLLEHSRTTHLPSS